MAKAKKGKPLSVLGNRPSSRAKRRKRASQAKPRTATHRRGKSTKPRLVSGSLTTSSQLTSVSLVNKHHFDRLAVTS